MRTLRIIIILAVLIGFPAVSWIYLNSGLKWRIKAQDETEKGVMLEEFTLVLNDTSTMQSADLKGMFQIMAAPQDSQSWRHLRMIHEQFKARHDFRILVIDAPERVDADTSDHNTWIQARCLRGCDALREILFTDGFTSAIVDDSLYVRGRYQLAEIQEMRQLTEHMAVVLPIEKRKRIELIRGNK